MFWIITNKLQSISQHTLSSNIVTLSCSYQELLKIKWRISDHKDFLELKHLINENMSNNIYFLCHYTDIVALLVKAKKKYYNILI